MSLFNRRIVANIKGNGLSGKGENEKYYFSVS